MIFGKRGFSVIVLKPPIFRLDSSIHLILNGMAENLPARALPGTACCRPDLVQQSYCRLFRGSRGDISPDFRSRAQLEGFWTPTGVINLSSASFAGRPTWRI